MSLGKNSIITFQHIVIQLVWQKHDFCTSAWLCTHALENEDREMHFSANHGSFQRVGIAIGCSTLYFFVTSYVAMSWLAVETSDVHYILKLASGDWQAELQATPSAGLSWAQMDQFTPPQLSPRLLHLVLNHWRKLALKERVTTNVIKQELE